MENFRRSVGTVVYSAGGQSSIEMPRDALYRKIYLRLRGAITIATAGSPVVYTESPCGIIKRIELVANGKDTIKSLDFALAMVNTQIKFGTRPDKTAPPTTATTASVNAFAILPLAMPDSFKEIDTLLNSKALSTLVLKITWGNPTDLYSTDPTSFTVDSMYCDVGMLESIGLDAASIQKLWTNKESVIEKEITATTSNFQIILPVTNIYRSILVKAEDDGDPVNTIINNIKLQSGTKVFFNEKAAVIQDMNKQELGLESMPAGYHYLDFCPDGRLSEGIPAGALSNLEMILDVTKVTGTNKVYVLINEIVEPAGIISQPAA